MTRQKRCSPTRRTTAPRTISRVALVNYIYITLFIYNHGTNRIRIAAAEDGGRQYVDARQFATEQGPAGVYHIRQGSRPRGRVKGKKGQRQRAEDRPGL